MWSGPLQKFWFWRFVLKKQCSFRNGISIFFGVCCFWKNLTSTKRVSKFASNLFCLGVPENSIRDPKVIKKWSFQKFAFFHLECTCQLRSAPKISLTRGILFGPQPLNYFEPNRKQKRNQVYKHRLCLFGCNIPFSGISIFDLNWLL